jgi:hypothetical protein
MLARQIVDAGESAFQLHELRRVGVQVVAHLVQHHQRFV